MTIEVLTNFKLSSDPTQQKKQVLPIFLHLYKQGLSNLYFSKNSDGCLIVWIDMNDANEINPDSCFSGLSDFSVTTLKNVAFIPHHFTKVTSSIEVLTENLQAPAEKEYGKLVTVRYENLRGRDKALEKAEKGSKDFDPFGDLGMIPGFRSANFGIAAYENDEFVNPFAKKRKKRSRYQEVERNLILCYQPVPAGSTSTAYIVPNSSGPSVIIPLPEEILTIPVPDTTEKTDITDERETGLTLTFRPKTILGVQLAEHDSEVILRELYKMIHNQPAPFNQKNWVRNRIGATTSITFSASGISLATVEFKNNAFSDVTSFSITLNRLTITKRSISPLKIETQIALYKAGLEANYNFVDLNIKRTVVSSNTKKLAKLTESFEGNKPQWKVHRDNANARYTLFPPGSSEADALESHLKTGGLKLFKRGKMTESKKEIVTVNLAQRNPSAPSDSNRP